MFDWSIYFINPSLTLLLVCSACLVHVLKSTFSPAMAIRYSFLLLGALVTSGRAAPAEPAPNPVVQIPDGQVQVPASPPDMVGYLLDGDDPEHPKPVGVPTWDSEATPILTG